MSCKEMIEWEQFNKDDPFAEERDDVHHALWLSMYHNAHSKNPLEADKFIPKWKTDDSEEDKGSGTVPVRRKESDLKVLLMQALKLGERQWERSQRKKR